MLAWFVLKLSLLRDSSVLGKKTSVSLITCSEDSSLYYPCPLSNCSKLEAMKGCELILWVKIRIAVAEAVCAIKNYSVNQKDEAVKDIKKLIDNLDARIESVENWMEKKQSQMSQTTREKAKATLKELRKQRNEVAEWYGGLKYSSAEAWEDVKQGFSNGYNTLTKSLSKALNEFSD